MRSIHQGMAVAIGLLTLDRPGAVGEEIDWNEARQFWAFQAPQEPALPEVKKAGWVRRDLDRFILHRLEAAGLAPEEETDRATLVRRVFYDLTGLPPAAAEVRAFVEDDRPDAYERLVDTLLDSPRFGERLASMWLTVARYAEDQAHQVGNDVKYFYPNAHYYRQWVIDSFNRDRPYDEFIRKQLAADFYGGDDLEALGFLGLGPQYYNRKRLEVMADEWEDRVDTVTRGFLALTVACARCHDHFYDPITTADYHALAGVFASTEVDKREVNGRELHIVKDEEAKDLPIFVRGNVEDEGPVVPRRFLQVLSNDGEPAKFEEGSGRRGLAEAIATAENPLTARVMVNRLWGEIFGAPLVATPSNFGATGQRPTHPELLDWLAVRFVEDGWSVKALVRELALSATYRQASVEASGNELLAGMNRRRLTAEMLRDSMLAVTGELDFSGGGSLKLGDPDNRRRTVFGRVSRLELDSFLRQFDYPDANVHAARRAVTTTPMQKLYLLNSPFVAARAAKLAEGIGELDVEAGIDRLFEQVLSRRPSESERALARRYFENSSAERDWAGFAQALLCSNSFLYRD